MDRIKEIEKELTGLRTALRNHRVYDLLTDLDDIRIFMEKHVFAVWDFMSLLKALQLKLTCLSLPWKPVSNPKIARFINKIVFGEESDLNELGVPKSHYEMYLEAMMEVGANTEKITTLIDQVQTLADIDLLINHPSLSAAERSFLNFTFTIVQSGEAHKIAAAFTFGREDLIPDMFMEIIRKSSDENKHKYPKLTYYLERHIEVDGDEHGPLSLEMVQELCGSDTKKWEAVLVVAKSALEERIALWEDIAVSIESKKARLPELANSPM